MRKLVVVGLFLAGWLGLGLIEPRGVAAQTRQPTPTRKVSVTPTQLASVTVTPSPTKEQLDEEIKQKVQERLNKASRRKKAYVGSLADIADSSLKISTAIGVKMAATTGDTVFLRSEKGVQTKIKINELPLDDFIIAMGYLGNGNGEVLETRRVISMPKPEADLRQVWAGQVAGLKKSGEFMLAGGEGKSFQIKPGRKTVYQGWSGEAVVEIKSSSLKEGINVVIVGVADKKEETSLAPSLIYVRGGEVILAKPSVSPTP